MGIKRINYTDKAQNDPGMSETIQTFQTLQNDEYDVFIVNHSVAGGHTDMLLPKARCKIRITGGGNTATIDYSTSLISGASILSDIITINISETATSLQSMRGQATNVVSYIIPISAQTIKVAPLANLQGFQITGWSTWWPRNQYPPEMSVALYWDA